MKNMFEISIRLEKNKILLKELENIDFPNDHITNLEELNDHYRTCWKIRLMESKLENLYSEGLVRGFCHLTIGQEGIYSAIKQIISESDAIITSYRCHALAYVTGCTIKEIICENLGLKDGNCKGKGGSMHLYNSRFYGGHGIVGAQVPLGTGIAFSMKYKSFIKEDKNENFMTQSTENCTFAFYGDGASNQGQIYESFNMAKTWKLPIVFVCENNKYGMYTPINEVSVDDNFYKRGYSIPGIRVKDTDFFEMIEVLKFSKEYCKINGPIIVQIDTERFCGHSTIDTKQKYRIESGPKKDVIEFLKSKLEEYISKEEIEKLKNYFKEEFKQEFGTIEANDITPAQDLFTDLFWETKN